MTLLIVRSLAEDDAFAAVDWYETQKPGLGDGFSDDLSRSFAAIAHSPFLHSPVDGQLRRQNPQGIPQGVYDMADDNGVEVVAIFHHSRNPDTLKRR